MQLTFLCLPPSRALYFPASKLCSMVAQDGVSIVMNKPIFERVHILYCYEILQKMNKSCGILILRSWGSESCSSQAPLMCLESC